MSVKQASDGYTYGDCTYGMALLFPEIASDMGDAKDWVTSARAKGYPVVSYPVAGSIVSYGAGQGYSEFGHVAAVDAVNPDGTFTVREMNYSGWNTWDTRISSMSDVQGFIIAPGSGVNVNSLLSVSNPQDCTTWSVSILGSTICMDAFIGVMAIGVGLVLMVAGVVVLIVATQSSKVGKAGAESADALRGAVPAARPAAETKGKTPAPKSRITPQASSQRLANAKSRAKQRRSLSPAAGAPKRSTNTVASTARAKLKAGADPRSFTASEAKWISANQEEATRLLKER